jgi:hypothetical protein
VDDQICTKDDKAGAATVGDAMAAVTKVRRAGGTCGTLAAAGAATLS